MEFADAAGETDVMADIEGTPPLERPSKCLK
jgi:hypothetical protein